MSELASTSGSQVDGSDRKSMIGSGGRKPSSSEIPWTSRTWSRRGAPIRCPVAPHRQLPMGGGVAVAGARGAPLPRSTHGGSLRVAAAADHALAPRKQESDGEGDQADGRDGTSVEDVEGTDQRGDE